MDRFENKQLESSFAQLIITLKTFHLVYFERMPNG